MCVWVEGLAACALPHLHYMLCLPPHPPLKLGTDLTDAPWPARGLHTVNCNDILSKFWFVKKKINKEYFQQLCRLLKILLMAFLSYSSPRFLRLRQFFPSCISESDLLEALGRPGETFFPCLKSAARGARINFFPFILMEISPSPIQAYVPSYGHNTKFMQ